MIKRISVLLMVLSFAACTSEHDRLIRSIDEKEEALKADTSLVPSEAKAAEIIRLYERFDSLFPADTLVPEYLFRAADLAQGFRHEQLALKWYARICKDFPDSRKAGAALFMTAFLYDYNLGEKEKAKSVYTAFLEKYPQHPLAPSAKASLEQLNLGLSDEELVKLFQQRADSSAKLPNE